MHQIITKRQLYRLKQSLPPGEAPLPKETMPKASCNVITMRDYRKVPWVQMCIPFYRKEYDIIMVRRWNIPQLHGGSASWGTDWIIIVKPCLQHKGGAIIITASCNECSIQPHLYDTHLVRTGLQRGKPFLWTPIKPQQRRLFRE